MSAHPAARNRDRAAAAVDAFLDVAVIRTSGWHRDGDAAAARRFLAQHSQLGNANVWTAAATGNAAALAALLHETPKLATALGGPRRWRPLSYLCFSQLLRFPINARERSGFAKSARLLLAHGADPNTAWTGKDHVREAALYGAAGLARDSALTRILLEAGADVNDGETLYHCAEGQTTSHEVLQLILQSRPNPDWVNYCLFHKMDEEDPAGVRLFIEAGADVNFLSQRGAFKEWRTLQFAILRGRSPAVVRLLLDAGADLNGLNRDGVSPLGLALRLGQTQLARLLKSRGAVAAMSPREEFLAACSAGDSRRAHHLQQHLPGIVQTLASQDLRLLPHAAAIGNLPAVRLMLQLGFPINVPGDWAGSALHQAAWHGQLPTASFLLRAGARTDVLNHWAGDVLHTAIHGAANGGHPHGLKTVTLIATHAGAKGITDKHLDAARQSPVTPLLAVLERIRAKVTSADPAPKRAPRR